MKKRIEGLDALKFILSFCIVSIHLPFPGVIGSITLALFRVAVPLFFMISGYFCSSYNDAKMRKMLVKVLKLLLAGTGLMILANIIGILCKGGALNEIVVYIMKIPSSRKIADVLLKNIAYISGPLWFLYAYVYVLLFWWLCKKANWLTFLKVTAVLLCIMAPIFGKYSYIFLNRAFLREDTRNWFFMGLPFFVLGKVLKDNGGKLHVSRTVWLLLIAIFSVTTVVEGALLKRFGQGEGDVYFSTAPLSICAFQYAITIECDEKIIKLANFGKKYSMPIYIVHPFVAEVLRANHCEPVIGRWLFGTVVFIISFVLAVGYDVTSQKSKAIQSGRKTVT